MRALFEDTLGFAGAKMIRRILGLAHVEDLESIADPAAAGAMRSQGASARARTRGRREGLLQPRRCRGRRAGRSPGAIMTGRTAIRGIWVGLLVVAAAMVQAARAGGRVLTPLDVVAIRIVDHPDLDWTTRVEPDGTINFPYVGEISTATPRA